MASVLEGALAKTIGNAMAGLFLPATLVRDELVPVSPTPPAWEPQGTVVPKNYPCRAIVEEYSEKFRLEGLVQSGQRKVLILANSLSVEPKQGDRVTVRGQMHTVLEVATDTAKAVWELRASL